MKDRPGNLLFLFLLERGVHELMGDEKVSLSFSFKGASKFGSKAFLPNHFLMHPAVAFLWLTLKSATWTSFWNSSEGMGSLTKKARLSLLGFGVTKGLPDLVAREMVLSSVDYSRNFCLMTSAAKTSAVLLSADTSFLRLSLLWANPEPLRNCLHAFSQGWFIVATLRKSQLFSQANSLGQWCHGAFGSHKNKPLVTKDSWVNCYFYKSWDEKWDALNT